MTENSLGRDQSIGMTVPVWRFAASSGNPDSAAGQDRSAGTPKPLAGKHVLVVEDEFFVGLEIAETLEAAGATIAGPAWTLADAESLAAQGGIDMAVLDANLNGQYAIDLGIELGRQGVRVVFATAHVDDTMMFQGEAASIPRIGKPASARALIRALLPAS